MDKPILNKFFFFSEFYKECELIFKENILDPDLFLIQQEFKKYISSFFYSKKTLKEWYTNYIDSIGTEFEFDPDLITYSTILHYYIMLNEFTEEEIKKQISKFVSELNQKKAPKGLNNIWGFDLDSIKNILINIAKTYNKDSYKNFILKYALFHQIFLPHF